MSKLGRMAMIAGSVGLAPKIVYAIGQSVKGDNSQWAMIPDRAPLSLGLVTAGALDQFLPTIKKMAK